MEFNLYIILYKRIVNPMLFFLQPNSFRLFFSNFSTHSCNIFHSIGQKQRFCGINIYCNQKGSQKALSQQKPESLVFIATKAPKILSQEIPNEKSRKMVADDCIEVFETTVDGFILIAFDKTELVILPGKKKKKFL
jgi:hypothetical protein